jgi:hypothetical protein
MAYLYGLVDAARDSRLFDLIVRAPDYACLFGGKLDAARLRASPYIVRLTDDLPLVKTWNDEGAGRSWGIKCLAENPLPEVRRHFREFLQAQLPDGRRVLFRFWDPRVWRVYLPTCNKVELKRWFEAVDEYSCESLNGINILRFTISDGSLTVKEVGPFGPKGDSSVGRSH